MVLQLYFRVSHKLYVLNPKGGHTLIKNSLLALRKGK